MLEDHPKKSLLRAKDLALIGWYFNVFLAFVVCFCLLMVFPPVWVVSVSVIAWYVLTSVIIGLGVCGWFSTIHWFRKERNALYKTEDEAIKMAKIVLGIFILLTVLAIVFPPPGVVLLAWYVLLPIVLYLELFCFCSCLFGDKPKPETITTPTSTDEIEREPPPFVLKRTTKLAQGGAYFPPSASLTEGHGLLSKKREQDPTFAQGETQSITDFEEGVFTDMEVSV